MAFYPKSTAYTRMFKLIASSDHLSKLTGGSPTVNISKAGGSFGAAGGTVTEVANGWYKVALNTTDTGTAGDLAFYITCASADDTDFVDQVVDPAVANLGVNTVNVGGTAQTARDLGLALPAVAPNAAGGLLITSAGSLDMDELNVDIEAIQTSTAGLTFTNAGKVDATVAAYAAGQDLASRRGTAQAGGASTITLDAGASATDNLYQWGLVMLVGGTGVGQARLIASYVGATKVATVGLAWTTQPDNTSLFVIVPWGQVDVGYFVEAPAIASSNPGVPKVDLTYIKTAPLLGTASLMRSAFDNFFSVVTPTLTCDGVDQTGDNFARLGVAGVGLTNLGDVRIAHLNADVTSRMATFTLPTNFSSLVIDVNGRVSIQSGFQKNVARAKYQFIMTDSTTHAPVTGKAGVMAATRSIDGGADGAGTLANIAEVSNGAYILDFGAGDLNGAVIELRVTGTGCDDFFLTIVTDP